MDCQIVSFDVISKCGICLVRLVQNRNEIKLD